MREVKKEGINVGLKKVNQIMKDNNLRSVHNKKRFKVTTTNSKHSNKISSNVVSRNFNPKSANETWVADITYIKIKYRFIYLAIVMDLYSRKVVGFKVSDKMTDELVIQALDNALLSRKPSSGLVFHSDRGVQYTSGDFREELKKANVIQSMSRKEICWDNAPAESFFATLKKELIYQETYDTKFHAERAILNLLLFTITKKDSTQSLIN